MPQALHFKEPEHQTMLRVDPGERVPQGDLERKVIGDRRFLFGSVNAVSDLSQDQLKN